MGTASATNNFPDGPLMKVENEAANLPGDPFKKAGTASATNNYSEDPFMKVENETANFPADPAEAGTAAATNNFPADPFTKVKTEAATHNSPENHFSTAGSVAATHNFPKDPFTNVDTAAILHKCYTDAETEVALQHLRFITSQSCSDTQGHGAAAATHAD